MFTAGGVWAAESQQQSPFVAPILVANSSFLNVRSGPGIQYSVLLTVVGGTELPVLGVARDRVWYQVSTVVGVGWVNLQFTLPRGDFTNVPFVEAPVSGTLVIQNTTPLVIQNTNPFAVLGQGGGAIETTGLTTVAPLPVTRSNRTWGVSILGGDLRAAPSSNAQRLRTAMGEDRSQIYPLLGSQFSEGRLWYQFTIPGLVTGWNEANQLQLRPLICPGSGQSAVIMTQSATPGSGPDNSPGLNFAVNVGEEYYAAGVGSGLAKIELIDGSGGWVPLEATIGRNEVGLTNHCSGISPVASTVFPTTTTTIPGTVVVQPVSAGFAAPHVVVNTAFLNVRSGPSAQFTVVATVPGGTELPVIGVYFDNVWYLVQGPFGVGWINNEFVLFRGTIEKVPIIREAGGVLATPMATVNNVVTLYAAPNVTFGTIGAISGPIDVAVVARTADGQWVQLNTAIGFGWVPTSQVLLRGDTSLIPVVAQ
jgi:uncharacterized protein YgiM (DUF1202 family)